METSATSPITIIKSPRSNQPPSGLYDLSFVELGEWMQAHGQPAYRAKQVWEFAYRHLITDYEAMSSLPTALRQLLATELPITGMTAVNEVRTSNGDTHKTLYKTSRGDLVETVLMLYDDRATVCVSCQVGCAVGCAFCATGLMGLDRNLTTGEMVTQVLGSAREARAQGRQLTNLVMMGMGEPFHNYLPTMKLLKILNDPNGFGMGARRMTISTSGVVPFIDKLADEPMQVNLAISLHAPNDELRSQLVPINRKHPVADLMAALERYTRRTGRRVSFEYALMSGINDSDEIADEFARLIRGRLCHVNIIPLNPVSVLPYERPTEERIERFAERVGATGIPVTVRYSRGVDISAACGQLRVEHQEAEATA